MLNMGTESVQLSGLSRQLGPNTYVRWFKALVCLAAIGLSSWLLSTSQSGDRIFGYYSLTAFAVLCLTLYFLSWCIFFALGRETAKRKSAKAALTSATLSILLGLLELPSALGIIDYRQIISPPHSFLVVNVKPWNNPANLLDQELIYLHRPGQLVKGETTGDLVNWLGISTDRRYRIDVQYDSHGFRNDHEIGQAPVVVLGDSFVEGVLVPHKELLASRLQSLLGVEVANLGQSGYGPQQELVVLKRFGVPLKPETVLWFFFEGNDLLDVRRYERFVAEQDGIRKSRDNFVQRSFLRNLLYTLAGYTAPRPNSDGLEAHRRSGKFPQGQAKAGETIYFAYAGGPLSKDDLGSLDKAQSSFLEARTLCEKHGAKLVLIYVPTKFRVYQSFTEFPDDGYGRGWQLNELPHEMEKWSRTNSIAYLDLTPALRESAAKGELVYFPDDGHWNGKGHQVVADTVARFLQSRH